MYNNDGFSDTVLAFSLVMGVLRKKSIFNFTSLKCRLLESNLNANAPTIVQSQTLFTGGDSGHVETN